MSDQKQIEDLKKYIQDAENSLEAAKKALFEITGEDFSVKKTENPQLPPNLMVTGDGKVIEGIFNGENMIGPEGKVFSVPANYASKSKLVEGDKLKLTVAEDGSFIFKQIGPAERKKLVGTLVYEDNMYYVQAEGKKYSLLHATVTFHKANPGDKVTIVVPTHGDSVWAALENIIHDVAPKEPNPEENLDLGIPNDNAADVVPPVEAAPLPEIIEAPPVATNPSIIPDPAPAPLPPAGNPDQGEVADLEI